jgi:hypothetical protein
MRGASDTLREPIEALLWTPATFRVASQQMSDRKIVNALAGALSRHGLRARALIESDYLYERALVSPELLWTETGEREEHRQSLLALIRGGVHVRPDQVSSALQHVNMVLAKSDTGPSSIFLTSANFAPGSLTRHLNWGLFLQEDEVFAALWAGFSQAWDGHFHDVAFHHSLAIDGLLFCRLMGGGRGQAIDLAIDAVETAQESIHFAYFNMAKDSRLTRALIEASARGVNVAGVVDGDQKGTGWDAVPVLHQAGVDCRYYPGALTGAIGRMHYKMLAIDGRRIHLSTANASASAEKSFELGVTLQGNDTIGNPVHYVTDEIVRLLKNAFVL